MRPKPAGWKKEELEKYFDQCVTLSDGLLLSASGELIQKDGEIYLMVKVNLKPLGVLELDVRPHGVCSSFRVTEIET